MPNINNWIPLESNPKVFNDWAKQAGLDTSSDQFHDLFSLDPEELAAIPRPVKAVVFVFPYAEWKDKLFAEDERVAKEGGPKIDESVFWMKQTIHNACGAMAMIHGIGNNQNDVKIVPLSPLHTFFDKCHNLSIPERSKLLEETSAFAEIHASVADAGQCALPLSDEHVDQAYTCFISAPGEGKTGRRVIELDGGRAGPVDWGECTDLLDDVGRIVRNDFIAKSQSVKFNVMYLGHAL